MGRIFVVLLSFLFAKSLWASDVYNTFYGAISGKNTAYDTELFLGIPYAQPPVDKLRWKAPRLPRPWNQILNATTLPPACPQLGNFFARVPSDQFGLPVGNEDCLYLNIWKPRKISEKLPVVFWIHGGSNFKGTAKDPMYDGAFLAAHANVVFVSINYRIGLLGAFQHKILSGNTLDRTGNYTTLDLIAGLKWVRQNIAVFGGDPENITIMGQSAGCMNVWGLLQSPLALGLYAKAVCSSGMPNAYPQAMAEKRSQNFIEKLIVNAGYAKDKETAALFLEKKSSAWLKKFLYSLSSDDLARAYTYTVPLQHIIDGTVFPHGLVGTTLGDYNKVPMIVGSTLDDGSYLVGGFYFKPDAQTLWRWIQSPPDSLSTGDFVEDIDKFQSSSAAASASIHLTLNNIYRLLQIHQEHVYHYIFKWKETPSPWKEIFGAVHGMDTMFYFGNFISNQDNFGRFAWTSQNKMSRERLRKKMMLYFKGFFWKSDPNAFLGPADKRWESKISFDSHL
ncbi:carboxylesterase family protein [Bdellovibrio sp. 22V]|uniref:carboxylesterase family protein n=1 Tax=Bdellovibrio sp. 22V TaxID=3044166 RepID=UPI002543DC18|nr:carboxylesterase family protein [Bdellovibrio sp. 22V]WII71370.1 carboxylesterase family protein [Bdellovibrio sp. 22V]